MKNAPILLAAAVALLAAGCAHHCGYVDLRGEQTPAGGETRTRFVLSGQPLIVTDDLTATNSVLGVRVEQSRRTTGMVRRRTYGRQVYAPWRFWHPVPKIVIAASGVGPVLFSWYDPHSHSDKSWRALDFFWDLIAWYNFASALPNGQRRVRVEEKLVAERRMEGVISEETVGVAGCPVEVVIGGVLIGRAVTDADGRARIDIAPGLTPELAGEDRTIEVLAEVPGRPAPAETSWTLSAYTMERLLRQRRSDK